MDLINNLSMREIVPDALSLRFSIVQFGSKLTGVNARYYLFSNIGLGVAGMTGVLATQGSQLQGTLKNSRCPVEAE